MSYELVGEVSVTKTLFFDASHHLEGYRGKCGNMHGHTYRLDLTFGRPREKNQPALQQIVRDPERNDFGMVVDFVKIKELVNPIMEEMLDHRNLDKTFHVSNVLGKGKFPTTCEVMAIELSKILYVAFREYSEVILKSLTLFETIAPNPSSATVEIDWVNDASTNRKV